MPRSRPCASTRAHRTPAPTSASIWTSTGTKHRHRDLHERNGERLAAGQLRYACPGPGRSDLRRLVPHAHGILFSGRGLLRDARRRRGSPACARESARRGRKWRLCVRGERVSQQHLAWVQLLGGRGLGQCVTGGKQRSARCPTGQKRLSEAAPSESGRRSRAGRRNGSRSMAPAPRFGQLRRVRDWGAKGRSAR